MRAFSAIPSGAHALGEFGRVGVHPRVAVSPSRAWRRMRSTPSSNCSGSAGSGDAGFPGIRRQGTARLALVHLRVEELPQQYQRGSGDARVSRTAHDGRKGAHGGRKKVGAAGGSAGPPPSARKATAPVASSVPKDLCARGCGPCPTSVQGSSRGRAREPPRRSAAVREEADRTGGLVGPRKACVPAAVALVHLRVEELPRQR